MKRLKIPNILKIFLTLIILLGILNIPVTTRQGVNFKLRELKIPLYIKIIEFMDRDYQYKRLVREIISGSFDDYEKTLLLFEWTCENIRKDIPEDWPIIDDHVWSIIVRGYGINDQLADVFSTLCVYAGFDTRIVKLFYDSKKKTMISAVKLKGEWILFDPYYRFYFTTPSARIATVKDLLADPSLIKNQTTSILHHGIGYSEYFKDLSLINFDEVPKPRAYKQNLFKRIYYEVKRIFAKR